MSWWSKHVTKPVSKAVKGVGNAVTKVVKGTAGTILGVAGSSGGSATKVQQVEPTAVKLDPTPTNLSDTNNTEDTAASKKKRRAGFGSMIVGSDRETLAGSSGEGDKLG